MTMPLPAFERNMPAGSFQPVVREPCDFQADLSRALVRHFQAHAAGNRDFWRFPTGRAARIKLEARDALLGFLRRRGFLRVAPDEHLHERLLALAEDIPGFERTYHRLGDSWSRALLIDLLCFRVLGSRHVRLPSNNPGFWKKRAEVNRRHLRRRDSGSAAGWPLHLYEIDGLKLHCHPMNILCTFLLEQYAYRRGPVSIAAGDGDVVIDGGACWGDTSLYFARAAGRGGRVHAFEFAPENLPVLRRNLAENPALAPSVQIESFALWDQAGASLSFQPSGPATRLNTGNLAVTAISIDTLVRTRGLNRLDFIKLDIEGAEMKALHGAEQCLRAFRPKLAISVYHKPDDMIVIPDYLESLNLGYRFFLDHFTIHQEETVLFCLPRQEGARRSH